jgi:hypothetical protein
VERFDLSKPEVGFSERVLRGLLGEEGELSCFWGLLPACDHYKE